MKTYFIKTNHEVFIDKFNEGELDFVNSYSIEAKVKAENPREAIKKYFENELYYKFDFESAYIPHEEEETEEKNTLHYSVLVDVDNSEASKKEVEEWKEDKLTLYSNNIFLTIYELNAVEV